MLIALYHFIMNVALPQIGAYAQALFEPTMLIIITLAGIVMMFGAVGLKISNNLSSTIANGIFRGIGSLFQMFFRAISWIVNSIYRLLPRVYTGSRKFFSQLGLNHALSTIFALLVTLIVIVIII